MKISTTNRSSKSEAGFSLIELLLAAAILVIIIGSVVIFASGFLRRNAAYKETAQLDQRRAVLTDLLRADFEASGRGLIDSNTIGSGIEPLQFSGNPDYVSYESSVLREQTTNEEPAFATREFGGGTGQFTFVNPGDSRIQVGLLGKDARSLNDRDSRAIAFESDNWYIYENGAEVANSRRSEAGPHKAGDSYIIQIENNSENGNRIVAYYRLRNSETTLMYRSENGIPQYPICPAILYLDQGERLTNLTIKGAPLLSRQAITPRMALLPNDVESGRRLTSPIQVSKDELGVTVVQGDSDTDLMYLAQPLEAYNSALYIQPLARGIVNKGDIIFVSDFDSQRSALFRVINYNADENSIKAEYVHKDNPAWNRLFSSEEDYSGYTFPIGTQVVKISPVVEWRVRDAGDGFLALMRREGNSAWTVGDLGVTSFHVKENIGTDGVSRSYEIEAEMIAEGVDAVATREDAQREPLILQFTPRYLNRTYNTQN